MTPLQAQRGTLDNGFQVLTVPLPHLHAAAAGLYVRVGSRYESAADSGLSHLLEHVLFRGCAGYPDTWSLNATAESICSGIDAATSREYMAFETTFRPRNLAPVVALLGRLVGDPLFLDVDVEKNVIHEELQDEVDERGRDIDVDNLSKGALFGPLGLGAKVGGLLDVVADHSAEDCRRWHTRHFVAENMLLVVAGPVTPQQVNDAARGAFARLPRGARLTPPVSEARADAPFIYVKYKAPQTDLQLSWPIPPPGHADWLPLVMAQRLLDDGSCARLRHRIVDQLGLAYHAGGGIEGFEGHGVFSVDSQVAHDNVGDLMVAASAVIADLVASDPDEAELERVKSRYIFELDTMRDSASAVVWWFGLQNLYGLADGLQCRRQDVAAVTGEAIRQACARHLGIDKMQLTAVGDLSTTTRQALKQGTWKVRLPQRRGAFGRFLRQVMPR